MGGDSERLEVERTQNVLRARRREMVRRGGEKFKARERDVDRRD